MKKVKMKGGRNTSDVFMGFLLTSGFIILIVWGIVILVQGL